MALFVPDDVLDPPLGTQLARVTAERGERALLAAVLLEAVLSLNGRPTLEGGDTRRREESIARLRRQAREWIMSNARGPMAFRTVCDHLGYDVDAVRANLARPLGIGRRRGHRKRSTVVGAAREGARA